jgi:beta-1,4-mannosyl-glycoprotein beta-1,4-N-acetylglucosaminyltransferase
LKQIFDTFIYSGEKELLISRISQLNPLIDYFVIAESKMTFTGRLREVDVNFQHVMSSEHGDKIRWITLDVLEGKNAWQREAFQRQSLCDGLRDIRPGDIIMLSDVDEIPSKVYLQSLSKLDYEEVLIAKMQLFRYCSHLESSDKWHGTIATSFLKNIPDMQSLRLRAVRYWLEDDTKIFSDGGTHFTTFLNAKQLKEKITSFSHTELNTFPFNNIFFLQLIIKLGLTIDGIEILKLNFEDKKLSSFGKCSSNHNFDILRTTIATLIQPSIRKTFLKRVKSLKSPD